MIGKTLNQFKVLDKLGSGGMGEVYRAEDTKLHRQVALKVLPKAMADNPERRMRFEREAKAVAALNHPNIVTIYSVEEAQGETYLTMELVQGPSLSEVIPENGLPVKRLLELAVALTDAIAAAHRKGITHRDLKPENVMLDAEGRLKVLDFGLAKLREEFAEPTDLTQIPTTAETREGMILGTVTYMSPEQAQGQPTDQRSDVFSLGIMLYEMATGKKPFHGTNSISILSSIIKDSPPPLSALRDTLPGPFGAIVERALQKRPEDRYPSAAELCEVLKELKREVDTGELTSGATGLHPALRPRRRGLPWLAAAAVLVALVTIWAAYQWLPRQETGPTPPAPGGAVDSRPSLAVFYFQNMSGDPALDWLRTGLTDMLVTDLSQSANLRVLDTARLYQILEDAGRHEDTITSVEAVQAVARRTEVGTAVVGSFAKVGPMIRISARIQDARSGEILGSERVEGEGESAIFALVDDLTRRIRGRFDLPAQAGMDAERDLTEVTTDSVEAYRFYAEGIRLHDQAKEAEAVPLLEKAVEVDPEFAMALAKLSVVHGNLQDRAKAEEYAKRALDLVDRLSARERYYIQGRYYSLRPETIHEAIAAYENAVERFPDHSAARNNLAQLYVRMDRDEEAIRHFERLREQGMAFPGTYSSLAEVYAKVGELEKGYDVLADYTRRYPKNAAGYRNLAMFAAAMSRYDEALEALGQAESLEPGNLEVEGGRWVVYVLSGRWDDAERSARTMYESSRTFFAFQGGGAKIVNRLYAGRLKDAMAILEEGERRFDAEGRLLAWALALKFGVQHELGDYAGGLATAEKIIRRSEDDPQMRAAGHSMAALCSARLGDEAAVRKHMEAWQRFLTTVPAELVKGQAARLRGALAMARGDFEAALREYGRAEEALPPEAFDQGGGHVRVWYGLAEANLALGRDEEAARWLGRIRDSRLSRLNEPILYVRSLYLLAEAQDRQGRRQEALENYRRFLEYWKDGEIDRERIDKARRRAGS